MSPDPTDTEVSNDLLASYSIAGRASDDCPPQTAKGRTDLPIRETGV